MTYPNSAGYTNKTTSKEAADKINMQYPRQRYAIEDNSPAFQFPFLLISSENSEKLNLYKSS